MSAFALGRCRTGRGSRLTAQDLCYIYEARDGQSLKLGGLSDQDVQDRPSL